MATISVKLVQEYIQNGVVPYGIAHMESGPRADSIWNSMESLAIYTRGDSQGG